MVEEIRIRYSHEAASGAKIVNSVITEPEELEHWVDRIKQVNYFLAGVDVRQREDNCRMPLDEGWEECKTVLWEPMTDGIYGEFNNYEAAAVKYNLTADDFHEIKNGELWIALND